MTRRIFLSVAYWYPLPLVLLGWEALGKLGLVHPLLAPSLEAIWAAAVRGIANGDLLYHAEWTPRPRRPQHGCSSRRRPRRDRTRACISTTTLARYSDR